MRDRRVQLGLAAANRIVDNNKYFRAYHMNKKMWTTIVLDGRLPTEEILKRIDDSYKLTDK